MEKLSARSFVIGFIAAAIAVVCVHQTVVFLLTQGGLIKGEPWSMKAVGPLGVPAIVNSVFWGGLWGALFAVLWPRLPGGAMWLRGLIYGLLILIVSNWLVLALIKGQPLFAGFDPQRMLAGVLILAAFGAATGAIYGALRTRE
jgi:hypothetical protein